MWFSLQLYGIYLNIETRLISELFTHWATRPAASASKRVLARRCSVQDSRIRSYFFAMLAVVHRELTDCSCKWFRKGARKCSQWSFLLDIVQKAFFNSKYIHNTRVYTIWTVILGCNYCTAIKVVEGLGIIQAGPSMMWLFYACCPCRLHSARMLPLLGILFHQTT